MAERRGRVLIVDDDAMASRVVARVLSKEHDIIEVRGGREALARLEAGEHYDFVICDLIMPEMTGMEFHERVQSAHMDIAERMIFMTGGAFTERAAAFVSTLPPGRCLEKPFESEVLRSIARTLVEDRQAANSRHNDEGRIDEAPPTSAPSSA